MTHIAFEVYFLGTPRAVPLVRALEAAFCGSSFFRFPGFVEEVQRSRRVHGRWCATRHVE